MFDEIRFSKIERLPNYVFAEVNAIKMAARRSGEDIIDFSMGNPDGRTPQHIIDKLCESAQKDKTHGYSVSQGIYKLRLACANWYKRKYGVILDPESEIVAVMGSKEGFVHLTSAIVNPGDVAVVPDPAYPIHTQAFIIAGGNVVKIPLAYDENLNFNENKFFIDLQKTFDESIPRPKYVIVNFPHNPTTVVVQKSFYERLVAMARQRSLLRVTKRRRSLRSRAQRTSQSRHIRFLKPTIWRAGAWVLLAATKSSSLRLKRSSRGLITVCLRRSK